MKDKGPSSSFLKVKCTKCKNEEIIFDKPSTKVTCLVCGAELAQCRGGKAKIVAKVISTLN
ncbi:30S ribosomal protein S27e [Candidatus Woesearchaeota archaeon]|nr:30S ribosomal protein S27e [Candidatus Woesearchaeota archaeon]MBT4114652.1 30S ribosomal protein S27e [Candidatus Woesearchaeota archaeon]MBT4248364.1 30S ribosomal protein S27e [Candidatus Woesearchaeota archaeon]